MISSPVILNFLFYTLLHKLKKKLNEMFLLKNCFHNIVYVYISMLLYANVLIELLIVVFVIFREKIESKWIV